MQRSREGFGRNQAEKMGRKQDTKKKGVGSMGVRQGGCPGKNANERWKGETFHDMRKKTGRGKGGGIKGKSDQRLRSGRKIT